ncbi:phosphatidylinositol 5-phosphate 4-kinase type-2 gamma-like [Zophobas morio]|jgi:1-phosphatidylinositol-5-phosphate 4-kinase|uniref:phosphatidylinositol 5-phosphate 4-kinase type-2 gamma-like n=1 Tax=Zophobas morio TaxID=2755281 RepID=UPI00308284AF
MLDSSLTLPDSQVTPNNMRTESTSDSDSLLFEFSKVGVVSSSFSGTYSKDIPELLSLGLRFSNFQFGEQFPSLLVPDHYKAYSKLILVNHLTSSENYRLNFKEFCPQVFRDLRNRFGITEKNFLRSLSENQIEVYVTKRSDPNLFISLDKKFIIKCIAKEELHCLIKHLSSYRDYVVENWSKTLLPRYFGVYRVKSKQLSSKHLLVMNNIFSTFKVVERYGLKGSTVERTSKERKKEGSPHEDAHPVLKDNDFRQARRKLILPSAEVKEFKEDFLRDTDFLAQNKLMDYSLLFGVAENPQTYIKAENTRILQSNNELYFFGLKNCLTDYSHRKKVAHSAKSIKYGTKAEVSTVNPAYYAKRIYEYVDSVITGI